MENYETTLQLLMNLRKGSIHLKYEAVVNYLSYWITEQSQ